MCHNIVVKPLKIVIWGCPDMYALAQILLSQNWVRIELSLSCRCGESYGPTLSAGKLGDKSKPGWKVKFAGFVPNIQGSGLPLGAHCMKLKQHFGLPSPQSGQQTAWKVGVDCLVVVGNGLLSLHSCLTRGKKLTERLHWNIYSLSLEEGRPGMRWEEMLTFSISQHL